MGADNVAVRGYGRAFSGRRQSPSGQACRGGGGSRVTSRCATEQGRGAHLLNTLPWAPARSEVGSLASAGTCLRAAIGLWTGEKPGVAARGLLAAPIGLPSGLGSATGLRAEVCPGTRGVPDASTLWAADGGWLPWNLRGRHRDRRSLEARAECGDGAGPGAVQLEGRHPRRIGSDVHVELQGGKGLPRVTPPVGLRPPRPPPPLAPLTLGRPGESNRVAPTLLEGRSP